MNKADEIFEDNLVPHNAKTIIGKHGVFRIRIGDYRALYRIDYQKNKIVIFKLDKRPKVYK